MDFHGYPSSLHKCLHPSMDTPQLLESWYHALFWPFAYVPSSVSHVEMTHVVPTHFAYLLVLMLALQMVPLSPSSSYELVLLCTPIFS